MVRSSILFFLLCAAVLLQAQPRQITDFNKDWKFYLGDDSLARFANYDDSKWRKLSLPHDWSIESDFLKDAPATNQGGSLPGGIGWYRKAFVLPVSAKQKNITIEFDGVYQNSEVWINGTYLGKRPNGYINFSYELTAYLKPAPQKNYIVVKVDNSRQPNSRWYTGSGIYRDVKLIITNKVFINDSYTFISSELFSPKKDSGFLVKWTLDNKNPIHVLLNASFGSIENKSNSHQSIEFEYALYDAKNTLVYKSNRGKRQIAKNSGELIQFDGTDGTQFKNPVLWSVENPYLYKAVFRIYQHATMVDEVTKNIGIRRIAFDAQKGFFLNDKPLKIYGVCMHHDLGLLGAAFNKAAAKRQLRILKEMGCNAIRFSHNPPASAMLDLCDEMGFLVIDEAFDMWKKKKNKYDYYKDFTEWHEKDLEAMVYRDRNHPSVICWSIGNEIREQFDSTGIALTKALVDIVKKIDPTKPVLSALTETLPEKNFITKAGALDVLGFNYKDYDYKYLPERFPGIAFIATETASAIATRGVYNSKSESLQIWPSDYKHQDSFDAGYKDFTAPAYDNTRAYWGTTHEKSWLAVKSNPHISGAFVWSGFDYLGEPLPYPKFPARSSYFGIVDLAGLPKDVYYMYQSEWTNKNVLHLFPHWNWNKGDTVDVWAYYNNADEVELFLNGRSVGKRNKTDTTLHVMWQVPFEPGSIKAISKKNGKIVLIKEIKTAGPAARIELIADKQMLAAAGKDIVFVTARIVDKDGNLLPDADNEISFSVLGNAIIAGTDNGYQADTLSLQIKKRKAWKGLLVAGIKIGSKKGNITLTANSPGLGKAVILLNAAY
jgi:beta-galactosidase